MQKLSFLLIFFIIISFACNYSRTNVKEKNIEFRQIFNIESFDSAVVNYGKSVDNIDMICTYDFSPIKNAINSAINNSEKMLWKGSFYVRFTNGTTLKISIYGGFFSESNSTYRVPEKYSKEFESFISNMIIKHSNELEEKPQNGIKK